MSFLVPAMMVGNYLQQRQSEKRAKKQAAAQILMQNAQSRGATPYGFQAVQAKNRIEDQTAEQSNQFGTLLGKYLTRNG